MSLLNSFTGVAFIFSIFFTGLFLLLFRLYSIEGNIVLYATVAVAALPFGLVLVLSGRQALLEQELKDTRSLSRIDDGTRVNNKRYFMERFASIVAKRHLSGSGSALLMIDVDHFKVVNDEYGHLVGDQVLRHVATTIRSQLRENDMVGRYGGEEFIVFLHNVYDAHGIAERIRKSMVTAPYVDHEVLISVTISIGMTTRFYGLNATQIIADADQALYKAKANGRNRVEWLAG